MWWVWGWSIVWVVVVVLTSIVKYRTDRFDPLWVPINGLCTVAVVSTTLGTLALILMD